MSIRRVAICDDIEIERDMLGVMLRDCDGEQEIVKFSAGEELLGSDLSFDLVFLDIFMSGMTGMEVARAMQSRGQKTPIVFLTSSSDFAVESYEVHAFDYIVKPIQPERLRQVWERFLSLHQENRRFLLINNAGIIEKYPYELIEFLESNCHYVTIHLTDNTTKRIHERLDNLERQLDDVRFLRCHKSYLINMSLVQSMSDDFVMQSGKCVAYRKRGKKKLQKRFEEYMRG